MSGQSPVACTLRVALLLLVLAAGWLWPPAATRAQTRFIWSPPLMLADPEVNAWAPAIAADQAGNVHFMWSQTMTKDPPPGEGDTLYYTRYKDGQWSEKVAVLVSPDGEAAEWPSLAVTPDGTLHAVWGTGGSKSRLLYARAPACCADNLWNWTKPVVLGGPINQTMALVSDSQGRLHTIYSILESNTLVYGRSDDGGDSWDLWTDLAGGVTFEDEYTAYPRLAVDDRGRVHAVWTILPYPGRAVMYAQSEDGLNWTDARAIDEVDRARYKQGYGPILIDVATRGEEEVHLIWDGAPTVERTHLWSADGGMSWSRPTIVFPEVTTVGRSGWNDMVIDSTGVLHAISIHGTDSPRYASWNGGWSASEIIETGGPVELMQLTISQGNVLHVVCTVKTDEPWPVWHMQRALPVPALPLAELPTLTPTATVVPVTPTATPTQPTPTPTVDLALIRQLPPARPESSPVFAVFLGTGAGLTLLIMLVGVNLRQRTRL